MRAIHVDLHAFVDNALTAPRPDHIFQTLDNRMVGNLESTVSREHIDSRKRGHRVFHLKSAIEGKLDRGKIPCSGRERHRGKAIHCHVFIRGNKATSIQRSEPLDGLLGRLGHHTADNRTPLLDNARLLLGDCRMRGTEPVAMIETNARDGRDEHVGNDVGCVEAASQSSFKYHDIRTRHGEELKSHGRESFEESHLGSALPLQALNHVKHSLGRRRQRIIRDGLSINEEALVERHEVRRRVARNSVARRAENRIEHGARRALAVRPRHMNVPQRVLGISKLLQHGPHHVESRTHPKPTAFHDVLQARIVLYAHILTANTAPSAVKPYPARISQRHRSVRRIFSGRPTSPLL